jgi:uncharacterized membrane protein
MEQTCLGGSGLANRETHMKTVLSMAFQTAGIASAAFLSTTPAIAGCLVPGPVLGAGAPALAAIAGSYWLLRRFRRS